jgi:hypothetical protein
MGNLREKLSSTNTAHLLDDMGGVKHQPEPPSQLTLDPSRDYQPQGEA